MFYRSISLNVFSLDQLLLMFAMVVIGGLDLCRDGAVGQTRQAAPGGGRQDLCHTGRGL